MNRKAVGGGLWSGKRRKALRRRAAVPARFEPLEPRALLAITGFPASVGNQFGTPIVLSTDGLGPNALTIVLDDVTNPGQVTATINGNRYFNFGSQISFTGTFDLDGSVENQVAIITPFGVDLGNGVNEFQWNAVADFTPAGLPDIKVSLIDADGLTIQNTNGPSSIVGTFHSPTLAPPPGATIDFQSSGVISVLAAGVTSHDLSLTTTANGVPSTVIFAGPVNVRSALAVSSKGNLVVDQPLTAITGGSITLTSTAGLIDVNKAVQADAAVAMTANQGLSVDATVTSLTAGITLSAGTLLGVNGNLTADTGVTLTGVTGIKTDAAADVVSATGKVALTSASGFVRAAGDLVATAGSVGVTAGELEVETAVVTALTGLTIAAGTDATLTGPTTITGIGGVTVAADNKISFAGTTTLLGLGDVDATAKAGSLVVSKFAGIKVADGTIDLQSVSGMLAIEALVLGNKTITIQAAQGIVLSNALDPAAEVRATGPFYNVAITNDANQILVDAPVTSQGGDVAITAQIDDVEVRDEVYGARGVKLAANTTLLVNGVAAGKIGLKADGGLLDLSSTTSSVTLGPALVVGTGLANEAGITITAGTVVTLGVPLVANGPIEITSPDLFTVLHPLTSNLEGIKITAVNGPVTSVLAAVTAGTDIEIKALNDVNLDNTLTSTGAGITISSTAGTVTTQPGNVLSAPSLLAGGIAITAGTFVMGNDITSGHDLTVQTATSFAPAKKFLSNAGSVTIDVTGGDLDTTASNVSAPLGSVTLSAAGDLDYGPISTGPAGSVSVTGGGVVTPLGPISVGGSINISTGSAYIASAGNDLTALSGNISITAAGMVDVEDVILKAPLGSVSLTSKTGGVLVGTAANAIAVSLTAGSITLAAPMGMVAIGQTLTAGGDISISSLGAYISPFSLTATSGDVRIITTGVGGSVALSKVVTAGGDVKIETTGANGSIALTAAVEAGGDVKIGTVGAAGLVTASAEVTAAGDVNIETAGADGSIALSAAVKAGGDVKIGTAGVAGLVTASAAVTAGGDVNIETAGADGSIALTAAVTAGGDVEIATVGNAAPVTVSASLTAKNDVRLQAAGAAAFIDVSSPSAAIIPVAGDLTLDSLADAVKLNVGNPLLSTGGSVTVSSALDLDVVATVTAVVGNVTLRSTAGNVFVKQDLFAGPLLGTLTIEAAGEINDGTAGGAITAKSVKAANFVAAAGPLNSSFPKFQFTNPLNSIGDLALTLTTGDGVDFVNSGAFTVSALVNDTGVVSLRSLAGSLSVAAAIGAGLSEALEGITLTAPAGITVTGGLATKNGPGAIVLTSTSGGIAVNGPVKAAPAAADFTATAGLGVTVTGSLFAGDDVTVAAGTAIGLGAAGSTITANTGSVTISSLGAGGIQVEADVFALSGSIDIETPDTLNFTGGSLTAAKPFVAGPLVIGLVRLDSGATTITGGAPVVKAGRFEVHSLGATPQTFTGLNEVDSLFVSTAGSFEFDNYGGMLSITDFDPTTPSVQVSTGGDLTIRQKIAGVGGGRFRVIDGIEAGGRLQLTAAQSNPGVEFVTTSSLDNTSPAFAGTLRDMLSLINQNAAAGSAGAPNAVMTAVFDEPAAPVSLAGTVTLAAPLPAIAKRITFDGSLLPAVANVSAGGIVGIDGGAIATPTAAGLSLAGGSAGTVVRHTAIHGFLGAGVAIASADNRLSGLLVGLDRTGIPDGNGVGIDIAGTAAARNVVGVATAGDPGNLVAGNSQSGIQIRGGANYTQVQGNRIGLDGSGSPARNGLDGISVSSSIGTQIGSATMALANVIVSSGRHGVLVSDVLGSSIEYGVRIVGNTIADNAMGGVTLRGGGRNLVGGFLPGEGNLISGNQDGVRVSASVAGATSANHVVGNDIQGNDRDGVRIVGSFGNRVSGNTVDANGAAGVRLSGAVASRSQPTNRVFSNTLTGNGNALLNGGIVLENSSGQIVGATITGTPAANVLIGNLGSGIVVVGSAPTAANANVIVNNSVTGSQFDGIRVQGGIGNAVRANVVAGSLGSGVAIVDAVALTAAQGNAVTGNAIGGNGVGILVAGGARNVIGGDLPALGNRVFSSLADGIRVESSAGTGPAVGIVIRHNGIGIDAGNAAAGNTGFGIRLTDAVSATVDSGNSIRNNVAGGVAVTGGNGVTLGAATAGRGNVVAANGGDGIVVAEPAVAPARTQAVTIIGNQIESNAGFGVRVTGGRTTGVTIGRNPSVSRPNGTGNTMRLNTGGGVQVDAAQAVTIVGNETINNFGPEIQLLNSANAGIAAPVLTLARARVPGQKTPQYEVRGTLNYGLAARGQRFYVDLYGNRSTDGKQFYLGRVLVTVAPNGIGSFRTIVNGGAGGVPEIVATATAASSLFGGTSGFSNVMATS